MLRHCKCYVDTSRDIQSLPQARSGTTSVGISLMPSVQCVLNKQPMYHVYPKVLRHVKLPIDCGEDKKCPV